MRFETLRWKLPVTSMHGYGANLVRVPGTASVLSTLPGGKLYQCDAFTGSVRVGKAVSGDLRAVVFDGDSGHQDGAWALATFGLCRISLASLSRTSANLRKGLGTYQGRMVALSGDALGISGFLGRSMKLVSRVDGAVLKTVRMGAPALVYRLPDGRQRGWSLYHAVVSDLDVAAARCVARHSMAHGAAPALVGDEVVALCGVREDDARAPNVWDVKPTQLVAFDAYTLQPLRQAAIGADAVEVLGADSAGRIVVGRRGGVTVHRPDTFAVEGTYEHHAPLGDALLLGEHDSVVLRGPVTAGNGLTVVRWS
ncbi:hypothetical protein [Dactylosporangium maewongense]|uniref:hypothetical protein n=1 Tax=Dactylosporangium maewongense TaxID=634393 RepID=UPI0031E12744